MELSIIAIIFIVVIFIFRSSMKKIVNTTNKAMDQFNDVVITNIVESRADINDRMKTALKRLEESGGAIDFEEAYMKAMGKK